MNKSILFSIFLGLFLFTAIEISAQAKKLLPFKKGVAVATGTIKGSETKTFYFKVKKDADIDISVDEAEKRPRFTLIKPNGKPFNEDDSSGAFDMLDILPEAGIYKIVLNLPEELKNESKPIKFTLRLVLR